MKIRTFNESDRESVIGLWNTCGLMRSWNDPNRDIDRKLQFQPELFLIGVQDSKVISSAMAGYDGHRGSVFYLAVSPEYQGMGYGRQLMNHIESLLINLGCPKLNIVVRSSNTKVLQFYSELDYGTDDVVSMGKRLIPDT